MRIILFAGLLMCLSACYATDIDKIESGCHGGFSGGGGGTSIHRDGKIYSWSLNNASGARNETLLKESKADFDLLMQQLDNIGFRNIDFDKPSNMTCFIRLYRQNQRIHSVVWPWGSNAVPKSVADIYEQIGAIAKTE